MPGNKSLFSISIILLIVLIFILVYFVGGQKMVFVGQKLKEARLHKGLTLDQVSEKLKIKVSFLSAIEKGDYKKLPSSAYALGFVRNYSSFLGLSERETAALFRREFDEKKVFDVLPKGFTDETNYGKNRFELKPGIIFGFLIFTAILIFIGFQYKSVFTNPPLVIYSPKENQVFSGSLIPVLGKTDQNSTVYVNKDSVSVDENGNFKKNITLFEGKETIVIKATSRFGKETEVKVNIEVKPQDK